MIKLNSPDDEMIARAEMLVMSAFTSLIFSFGFPSSCPYLTLLFFVDSVSPLELFGVVEALEVVLAEESAVLGLPAVRHALAEVVPEVVAATLVACDAPPRRHFCSPTLFLPSLLRNLCFCHYSKMKALCRSPSLINPNTHHRLNHHSPTKRKTNLSFSNTTIYASLSTPNDKPMVVVGSANADIYLEVPRLPKDGETISATTGQTLAGGKGANQACCGGKLAYPTYFLGQVGMDAHGRLVEEALEEGNVRVGGIRKVAGVPTGHAVVMLQEGGQNSIVIVGGANICCWPERLGEEEREVVRKAGIVLLQREIPDWVNIQVAEAANSSGVLVILDAGGIEGPIPAELLKFVDILSPNETELARLTGMPTETFEQISQAVSACHEMGVKQVLVKLGAKGSALFVEGEEPIIQPIFKTAKVLDTTGAGDTFTAAFAVALVEGKTRRECMQFAAAAASLCIQVMGAIPSMPDRDAVMNLLQSPPI